MLTYTFNSQHPRVKNQPKGGPYGQIGPRITKKKIGNNNDKMITKIVIIIIKIIIVTIMLIVMVIMTE